MAPKGIHIKAMGTFTTKVTPPGGEYIRVRFAGTELLRWNLSEVASVATGRWVLDVIIEGRTAGNPGSVEAHAVFHIWNDVSGGSARTWIHSAVGGAIPVNTTAAANLEITWQWDTAAALNSATMRQCTVWAIN